MSQLTDTEIEEAAAEAGISPAELRAALAEQAGGGAIARRGGTGLQASGMVPPSPRGVSVANAETTLPYPPEQAVRNLKHQIERAIGSTGHMMGSTEADIYDEAAGIIYRIQAESDGAKGSLVRVDIDPTPLRSRRLLTSMGLGATVGLFAVSGLIIPGLIGWALIAGAVGLTALGGTAMLALRQRAIQDARAITANALVEAEHGTPVAIGDYVGQGDDRPKALPPAREM
ncbi:hypothetical protein DB30_01389 [Enhygromyxa salina]|uniref:Uncharacterized protein n=1 Tax=Enhygromyxa salina TaxID=215803 RepID=A0A0C2D9P7_9BACT|nr:hypothetical protein [Enhygromyxa salina]KIG18280.1 hypothetical protein DB30_01389 [Enhygromyxa salina]